MDLKGKKYNKYDRKQASTSTAPQKSELGLFYERFIEPYTPDLKKPTKPKKVVVDYSQDPNSPYRKIKPLKFDEVIKQNKS